MAHPAPASTIGPSRPTQGHGAGIAVAVLVAVLVSACSAAPQASDRSIAPGTAQASATPSATRGAAASAVAAALGRRDAPHGATAPVDDASWLIADRLAAPAYSADTTVVAVAALARSGIGTYADTGATAPDQPLTGIASPLHLLDFQAHALAVGAWSGGAYSGAELDAMLPTPAGATGMATTSDVLAAYVAAADSPGGALSRALMAGQDLLSPATLRFPAVVLDLFASDLATDGRSVPAPSTSPSPTAAAQGPALLAMTRGSSRSDTGAIGLAATGGVCSATANWIEGTISSLFNALKLATPDNLPAAIVVSIWNWLVTVGETFVQGLISSVTAAVLGTIRSIAGTIAAVATQISSLLPYGLRVTAAGPSGGGTFMLGPDPQPGTFTVSVSAGDLPDWPPVLADCAKTANIALADFHGANVQLSWGPLRAPADPLLTPTELARTEDVTDANGQASWPFTVSSDPGDPNGEQQNQVDAMPVTVHRPEVEAARAHLTSALLGFIPGILQPFVASLFAPYINGLQARLNALLDARGTGTAILVYHAGAKPTPSAPPTPAPSGACSPSPVAPGTYKGTTTNVSSEIIDLGVSGGVVDHNTGSGKATVIVAADGSLGGTWDLTMHEVFDETAKVNGVTGLHDHRVATFGYSGGTFTGTACDLSVKGGKLSVVSCVDSLKGDCSGDFVGMNPTPVPVGFGPPSSVAGPQVTWTLHLSSTAGAVVTDDFTIVVSSAAP